MSLDSSCISFHEPGLDCDKPHLPGKLIRLIKANISLEPIHLELRLVAARHSHFLRAGWPLELRGQTINKLDNMAREIKGNFHL